MGASYKHHAILQRLDVTHVNGGVPVFYSHESFGNADDWENIPLLFAEPDVGVLHHPESSAEWDATDDGAIPAGFRYAGYVRSAYLPEDGAARLEAELILEDEEAERLAKAGTLGISTGVRARTDADGKITGTVRPNHVLLFAQGACPNCFPNDKGAMLMNVLENTAGVHTMTDTKTEFELSEKDRGFFASLIEKMHKNTEEPDQTEDLTQKAAELERRNKELAEELEQLKNVIAARDKAEAEAREQEKRDAAWNGLKNSLPAGWLGENEAETRAAFETDPSKFAGRIALHMAKLSNAEQKPEGNASCGCMKTAEERLQNTLAENQKKIGYTPME